MILVDTSVWVDHLRIGEQKLSELLEAGQVLTHPFVIGELALGSLSQRELVLEALAALPGAIAASNAEILYFIERHALAGRGVGLVDTHLLAAAQLTSGARLWTRDKRLSGVASDLNLAFAAA